MVTEGKSQRQSASAPSSMQLVNDRSKTTSVLEQASGGSGEKVILTILLWQPSWLPDCPDVRGEKEAINRLRCLLYPSNAKAVVSSRQGNAAKGNIQQA